MRLPDSVLLACKIAGIKVHFANRAHIKYLNELRITDEPGNYGGYYWMQIKNGVVKETDEYGPFRSESAALRDAFMKLQLRRVEARKGQEKA